MKRQQLVMAAALLMGSACTQETELTEPDGQTEGSRIIAYTEQLPSARTCISTTDLSGSKSVAVLWTPSDELGVFTNNSENNIKYTKANTTDNEAFAAFVPSGSVSGTPVYAYYPYSESAGTDYTKLSGILSAEQTMDPTTGSLPGDHKVGQYKETSDAGVEFTFTHLFSPVQIVIDGSGTGVSSDTLKSIGLTVKRGDTPVTLCGDFTFNATNGSYTLGSNTDDSITFNWATPMLLSNESYAYGTILPTIQTGDELTFTIRTSHHTATVTVTAKVNFQSNYIYTFPLRLDELTDKMVVVKNTPEGGEEGGEETPVVTTGTFTCATYNVDGLPNKISIFTVNGDGPGSDGTTNISAKIAEQNWDFIGFSEDFNYHTELTSSLSNTYTFGTHRGTVTGTSNDTDGLGFATKNSTTSFANESWTAFTSSYGGLTAGANTCIDKGFRHYEVTVAEGVVVDVIITHMNTYSSSGSSHINAQHAQLTQIAEYINTLTATNHRPVIFMGDTNCRYTRHDFQTYFWGKLNSGLTYADPWVMYQWDGVYPTYPSNSLMVSDATGTSDTDIICKDTQKGEVVDKIIYINDPEASVQLKADSYLRDYDNFNGLADHMPIVAKFTYTKTESN